MQPPIKLSELSGIRNPEKYRCIPYLNAAIALQQRGPAQAIRELKHLTANEMEDTIVAGKIVILCRMLFASKPKGTFRGAMIGAPGIPGNSDYHDWKLEPIELVDGIPFLIVQGYSMGGYPEPAAHYLKYCLTSCQWNPFMFTPKDDKAMKDALNTLLASPKWKRPLNNYEREFLTGQIGP